MQKGSLGWGFMETGPQKADSGEHWNQDRMEIQQSHSQWPTNSVCTWLRRFRKDKLSLSHTHRTHAFTSAWQRGPNRSDFWISESGEFQASCP